MIKQLKRNFIIVTTILTSSILLFVFSIALIITYRNQRNDLNRNLEEATNSVLRMDFEPNDIPGGLPFDDRISRKDLRDEKYIDGPNGYSFAIRISLNGDTMRVYNVGQVDEEELLELVQEALNSDKDEANLSDYNVRFKKTFIDVNGGQIVLAFTTLNNYHRAIRRTLLVATPLYFILIGFFALLNTFISGRILKPVKESFDNQQQFLADASHDLKTPLTVIMANTDILLAHEKNKIEDEKKWLLSTSEEALRMRKLVESLLETAKTSNMKEQYVINELNVSNLTESYLLQIETVAFEKGCIIESDIEKDLMWYLDEGAYLRILSILLDNAIKYSYPDTTIKVSLSRYKNIFTLSVNNFGEVIGEEDLPHLFKRFYRAEKARSSEGHGLGLSIAENLSKSLNGKISCTSSEEDGTTFQVIFKKIK